MKESDLKQRLVGLLYKNPFRCQGCNGEATLTEPCHKDCAELDDIADALIEAGLCFREEIKEPNGFGIYPIEWVQKLEQRLANAIEPKFKKGDEAWFVDEEFDEYIGNLKETTKSSHVKEICKPYYITDEGLIVPEENIFATQAEALEALEKLKEGR